MPSPSGVREMTSEGKEMSLAEQVKALPLVIAYEGMHGDASATLLRDIDCYKKESVDSLIEAHEVAEAKRRKELTKKLDSVIEALNNRNFLGHMQTRSHGYLHLEDCTVCMAVDIIIEIRAGIEGGKT
jgi:hypothetical protein